MLVEVREKWKIGDFWEKWQAYSLTFWPKLGVLRHFLIFGGRSRKLKIGAFWEKWQAYSLTFWPKLGVLRHFLVCGGRSRKLRIGNFWEKWQAYSLTLWPKLGCFEALFDLWWKVEKVENRRFLGKMASL